MLLRHYLEQGLTKRAIARKLGVCRRTIYHWIEQGQLDREVDDQPVQYGPRLPVDRKIDPYRAIIDARLTQHPKLTVVRLFDEIRAAGYGGGYTQVKDYVRQVRPTAEPEPVVRFETPAGHQGQVDFAEFRLPWGKRHALLVVLGYSRLLWLQYYERQTMEVLMRGLEAAFMFFGGVPAELLFDQMKSVVVDDRPLQGGALFENEEFLRFAAHWGFRVRACRPYRAQTKGKVERPIRYARESFFYGRDFLNDEDLNTQARSWVTGTANVRVHGTTRERPQARFERDEQTALAGGLRLTERDDLMSLAQRDQIRSILADLKMPGSLEAVDRVLSEVDGGTITASEAIARLLSAQVTLRNNRRLTAAMRSSRLPAVKTLEDFDFSFQPSIKREQIESLHELGFIERKENVVFLGPPGVGKTHLAISLAIAAAQHGRRVYYGTLIDLVTSLEEAQASGQLQRRLSVLSHPSVLVVDEIGYLPINHTGAVLFFQLMNRRYERASTVLTSNKGFEEWGEVFQDDVMAAALIDRLVHHCHLVNIRGNSFRMREHAALYQALRADTESTTSPRRQRKTKAEASS